MSAPEGRYMIWLKKYLSDFSSDMDVEVIGDYLGGILSDTDQLSEAESLVNEFLSVYLSPDVAKTASKDIVQKFVDDKSQPTHNNVTPNNEDPNQDDVNTVEDRLRAMMRADSQRVVEDPQQQGRQSERDACTVAALCEAGVTGYLGDEQQERDMEIALANSEFLAMQRINSGSGCRPGSGLNGVSGSVAGTVMTGDYGNDASSESDLDDIEHICGYEKKGGVKPGTVEDALAVLNPSLFGPSRSIAAQARPTGISRLPTPGDKPPGHQLALNEIMALTKQQQQPSPEVHPRNQTLPISASQESESNRKSSKKKAMPASKRIAKIGAKAEQMEKTKSSKLGLQASSQCPIQSRRADMEAFLLCDDSSDSGLESKPSAAPLPESGRNRERVIQAEKEARAAASAQVAQQRTENKTQRSQQLDQIKERKQAAQKKAQKVERHRH